VYPAEEDIVQFSFWILSTDGFPSESLVNFGLASALDASPLAYDMFVEPYQNTSVLKRNTGMVYTVGVTALDIHVEEAIAEVASNVTFEEEFASAFLAASGYTVVAGSFSYRLLNEPTHSNVLTSGTIAGIVIAAVLGGFSTPFCRLTFFLASLP
jgi:hypothetical protein